MPNNTLRDKNTSVKVTTLSSNYSIPSLRGMSIIYFAKITDTKFNTDRYIAFTLTEIFTLVQTYSHVENQFVFKNYPHVNNYLEMHNSYRSVFP